MARGSNTEASNRCGGDGRRMDRRIDVEEGAFDDIKEVGTGSFRVCLVRGAGPLTKAPRHPGH